MEKNDQKAMEECFDEARITDELCDSSIKKYESSIRKFFEIVGDKRFKDLILRDFNDLILEMKKKAGNTRIANVISAMKWILKKMQDEGKINNKLDLSKIKKPKIMRKEVIYLTKDEIQDFLNCILSEIKKRRTVKNTRFIALVLLLTQTGCRIGEALSININDIDWKNKEIPIIGKGNKPRTLFLTKKTIFCLRSYLNVRHDYHKALFVIQNGKNRWKQTDVGRCFRRYRKKSGLKKKFTPHTLRHTFATQYIIGGASLNVVQAALGHSDPMTTLRHYIGAVNKQKVKEMINDKHFDFISNNCL